MDFTRTRRRLEYELHEDEFTRGVQMCVEVGGARVFDVAEGDDGIGGPMTSGTVFRVYCSLKPVTAIAVAQLVEAGVVDLDAPIAPTQATARHLLTHTAGLHRCRGSDIEMLSAPRRRAVIEALRPPPGWRVGIDAGYSEAAAWHLLGWLVEDVTGEDLRARLRTHVLEPFGMSSTWIGMTGDDYEDVLPRLGINVDVRARAGFPMLYERSARVCCETNPAFGGYSTARDLTRFYTQLRRAPSPFCATARPATYDEVLDRECAFGLGFMTSLSHHAFGAQCSTSSFGHSGYAGASFAFADPAHDLAVGVIFNGIVGHDSAFLRREALVRALYADLADG
jgi:CubicO group peptidase (beta-lactamase class C family)